MVKLTFMLISNLFLVPFLHSQLSGTTSHVSFKDAFFSLGIIPGYYCALPYPWHFGQFVKDVTKCIIMIMTLYCGPVLDFILYHISVSYTHLDVYKRQVLLGVFDASYCLSFISCMKLKLAFNCFFPVGGR